MGARGEISDRAAGLDRGAVRETGRRHDSGHRLHGDVHAAQPFGSRVPAVGPPGGQHQFGPGLVQDVPADAQPFEDAFGEVLHHDVGLPGQLKNELPAPGLLEVQADTLLARVEHEEGLPGGLAGRAPPDRLAFEWLDLDHRGPE